MLLKLGQVTHDVVVSNRDILFKLIIKGLSADLNADAQGNVDIDDRFFESCVKDAQMPFARLLDRIVLLISRCHDLIKMYIVV